jgi:aldose 1-epimerase
MKQILCLAFIVLFAACKQPNTQHSTPNTKFYGLIGKDTVFQYTLLNQKGMEVDILNYGGTITNLFVPDKQGVLGDVVLGFDSLSGYLQKGNPYFGCLVGRYANRIAHAKFTLDDKEYQLAANNNGNTLHGGIKGFDKVIWNVLSNNDTSLVLQYKSADGEEGYPGNLTATVVYTLTPENGLHIDYTATTDKATPVNLTNHSYFNLSAGKDSTILKHELGIWAECYLKVDSTLIPTKRSDSFVEHRHGPLPKEEQFMDFPPIPVDTALKIHPKQIGEEIDQVKGGYDHNWVLYQQMHDKKDPYAFLFDPTSGRYMEIFTDQPGLQFYSGNFLDGSLTGKKGMKYVLHGGMALETQHYPDSPNRPEFPNTILKPGETYHTWTEYRFSVK